MKQDLELRLLTGAVFLPVLFFLIRAGGWPFTALIFLIAAVGAWEWWRLGKSLTGGADLVLVMAGVLGTLQGGLEDRPERLALFLTLFLALSLLVLLRHADGRALLRAGHLVLGMLYVGLLPAFLIRMRSLPHGAEAVYMTYAVVFLCDTCAYALGRAFGRRPLWPRISPKKTWEGFFGGLLGALLAALVCRAWFAHFLDLPAAIGFGAIAGTLGQAGDLVESLWKRESQIKDSSALIPGHGGALDRFDNLHFVAPVLYTYLVLFA